MVIMDRRTFLAERRSRGPHSNGGSAGQLHLRHRRRKMIGIQVGAVSLLNEGTEKVLDEFQQDALINTLFLATFTYGRGILGWPET